MEWFIWNDETKRLVVLCHVWQALLKDDKIAMATPNPFEIVCHYSAKVRHIEISKIEGHFPQDQFFPKLKSIQFPPRSGCLTKWDNFPMLLKVPKCHPFCELPRLTEQNKLKIHSAVVAELCLYRHVRLPKDLAKMISAMVVKVPYGVWYQQLKKLSTTTKKIKN